MDKWNHKTLGSAALLLSAALIWGVAFVAQSAGMAYIGPFTFSAVRGYLAAAGLLACVLVFDRVGLSPKDASRRATWKAGLILGVLMFVAGNLQQLGLQYTTAGKAGFITTLYIVLVPIYGIFLGRRTRPVMWLWAALATAGLYCISVKAGFSVGKGDLLVLGCAFAYGIHILVIDHYANKTDVVRMSCIQFFVMATLSLPFALLFEQPSMARITQAWLPLVYAGIFSGSCAYTMQMLGQRRIEPATASLLLSPEAVFAALAGWVLLGETLTARELFGCALVFAAVICSQIPWHEKRRAPMRAHGKTQA